MPLDFRFRLSLYLTLATATLCLALAEQALLPGIFFFVGPVVALMLGAFLVEGRWVLPGWAANLLGLVIAAGWGVWVDQRFFDEDSWRETVPVFMALLPDIGPALMLLVLGKLFRKKGPEDFWPLQGLGLVEVGLGCVLGFTPYFGACLFVYLVCALWSLALFNLRGGTEGVSPAAGKWQSGKVAVRPRPVRWALGATAAALGLCLLLPRGGQETWNPLRLLSPASRPKPAVVLQTGGADQIDLNRTGWVEVNDEVALVVQAEDAAGQPKLDLSPGQRWRGVVLDQYRDGRWAGGSLLTLASGIGEPGPVRQGDVMPPPGGWPGGAMERPLFDLGPRQFFLTFVLDPRKAGGLFLADPVVPRGPSGKLGEAGVQVLQQSLTGLPLFVEFEGTLVPGSWLARGVVRYRQVTLPPEEPDLGPPVSVHREYAEALARQPVPELTAWTRQLVRRLASGPDTGISPGDLEWQQPAPDSLPGAQPDGALARARWEKVARALTAYLAHSPEYTYSLELRRQDWNVDPTLDFLCNVKQGHCNRYAGGLALMLRSLGIPARIVMGFRGAESRGDGTYEVHSNQAHAWVEVLVPRPAPAGELRWHWLALDPTPAGEPPPPPWFAPSLWWERTRAAGAGFWKFFVVDYNADQQERLWSGLRDPLRASAAGRLPDVHGLLLLGLLPAALAAYWLLRRVRFPGHGRRPSPVAFFRRLLAILARRRGLRPAPSQTPREFAELARQALGALPAELAALPAEVAELLYRVRFGAVPLNDAESQEVDRRLARLDAALAGR